MSFGKLYSYPVCRNSHSLHRHVEFLRHTDLIWQGNPRTTSLLAVAKANNLKLDIEHTEPAKGVSDDYRKLNKLGQVPTFEGSDGYILSECIAIAIYRKWSPYQHPTIA